MSWKRGNQSLEIEVSRLQTKTEDWSEILDGEDGMIRIFQAHETLQAERDEQRDKKHSRAMLFCAACALLPILHDLPAWIHSFFK